MAMDPDALDRRPSLLGEAHRLLGIRDPQSPRQRDEHAPHGEDPRREPHEDPADDEIEVVSALQAEARLRIPIAEIDEFADARDVPCRFQRLKR